MCQYVKEWFTYYTLTKNKLSTLHYTPFYFLPQNHWLLSLFISFTIHALKFFILIIILLYMHYFHEVIYW